jgi:hypothetical protein
MTPWSNSAQRTSDAVSATQRERRRTTSPGDVLGAAGAASISVGTDATVARSTGDDRASVVSTIADITVVVAVVAAAAAVPAVAAAVSVSVARPLMSPVVGDGARAALSRSSVSLSRSIAVNNIRLGVGGTAA